MLNYENPEPEYIEIRDELEANPNLTPDQRRRLFEVFGDLPETLRILDNSVVRYKAPSLRYIPANSR